jgi:glyceraldehyde-3-phosphate dehydrogenase (NADP+)
MTDRTELERLFPDDEAIPAAWRLPEPLDQRTWLVDGVLHTWDGPVETVHAAICAPGAPPRPRVLGSYPMLGEAESLAALAAAERAWGDGRGPWPTLSVAERIAHVEDFVFRMIRVRAEVVRLLQWEIGKTLKDSEKEFDRTVDYVRDTLDALKQLDRASSRFELAGGVFAQVRRAPLGVVLCMGPYNYPLNETFTTLIPALLMGNPVIFKPPRHGVLLHAPLLTAFRDAFPPGVVNTVYGEGARVVGPLMRSGRLACLAFIGSSRVADLLKAQHPKPHRLRCVLGLEAKNAGIVLPDADLDGAVAECVLGALSYNGQRCTALKLLFVHRSVVAPFLERLVHGVDALKAGMPWDPGVAITPLPSTAEVERMGALLADAVAKGARVLNAGGGESSGTLFRPAVVYPVAPGMRLWSEEQFGPLVAVAAFDDVDEPVEWVVRSDYGQQVSLFGSDPETMARLIDPLVNQVCRVNLNSQCQRGPDTLPFTGRKDSAEGTLSVTDALRVFSIRTLVAAKETAANKALVTDVLRHRRSKFLSTDFLL